MTTTKAQTFTATTKAGQTQTRNSKTMVYTHAVVVNWGDAGETDGVYRWSQSETTANKVAADLVRKSAAERAAHPAYYANKVAPVIAYVVPVSG